MKELLRKEFIAVMGAAMDRTPEGFAEMLMNLGIAAPSTALAVAKDAMLLVGDKERMAKTLGIVEGPYRGPKCKLSFAATETVMAMMLTGKKIQAIKVVRENTGLGLKEGKDFVDLLSPDCANFNDVFDIEGGAVDPVNLVGYAKLAERWKAEINEKQMENDRLRHEIRGLQEDLRRLQDDIRDETARAARANDDASEAEEACRDIRELRVSHIKGVLRNGEEIDLDFGTIPVCLHAVLNLIENAQDTRHELAD